MAGERGRRRLSQASRERQSAREQWIRRQAAQIVAQLPDNDREAQAVLDHARELVAFSARSGATSAD